MSLSDISKGRGVKERTEPKVGLAYSAFFLAFKEIFPEIEIISEIRNISKYNLVIFPGGEDIDPAIYSQKNILSQGINKERDGTESTIFNYCRHYGIKALGVCRGHQLINAILGGQLIQDLRYDPNIRGKNCVHEPNHKLD